MVCMDRWIDVRYVSVRVFNMENMYVVNDIYEWLYKQMYRMYARECSGSECCVLCLVECIHSHVHIEIDGKMYTFYFPEGCKVLYHVYVYLVSSVILSVCTKCSIHTHTYNHRMYIFVV